MSPPIAKERVLSTLNSDGTRVRIRPRLYPGKSYKQRRIVAWFLMVLFVGLPFLRINGKPAILLDVAHREFILFGRTFLPTDGVLLMLLLLAIFVAIVWITALLGRSWCGWACPQTVYMEFLFRPIERLFEGRREEQMLIDREGMNLRRISKNVVFVLLSVVLGNVFLSYFVGVDALRHWLTRPPTEHFAEFMVVAVTSGLVFLDFAYFREQMCTVACPYARLQSVLLDRKSLIVGYDVLRGEPRGKGKPKPGQGDCIDCQACVVACPTGIDIRQGLQLECIACNQCADACDFIMEKVKKPKGLIRYASQDSLERHEPIKILRPRVLIYPALLAGLVFALVFVGRARSTHEITVLRGLGAPFNMASDAVTNQIRIKVHNRGGETERFKLEVLDVPGVRVIAPELPLSVPAGAQRSTSVFVVAPKSVFTNGQRDVRFVVRDEAAFKVEIPYKLLGPSSNGGTGSGS